MKKIIVLLVLSIFSLPAFSAGATCPGTIDRVFTQSGGAVSIYTSWRSDYVQICNVLTEWKGVDPTVCMVWVSNAQSAVTTRKPTIIRYDSDSGLSGDCSTVPTYSNAPSPGYLMLRK